MTGIVGHRGVLLGAAPAPAPTDPDFANVHALLHFASLTVDSSSFGRTVAKASGGDANTVLDTSIYKFAPSSMNAHGGFGVAVANSTLPAISGDFTLEQWVYFTTASGSRKFFFSAVNGAFEMSLESTGRIGFRFPGPGLVTEASGNRADSSWHHVALTRSGTAVKLWVDGVNTASGTSASSVTLSGNAFIVGSEYPFDSGFGRVDEFRLTVGVCRYTSTFTPPSSPFPDA